MQTPYRLRVLLADDEPLILRAITRVLEGEGHEVFVATNAHEANATLDRCRVDAAVLDVGMPGGGLSVARRLVDDPTFSGPVILMTGGWAADTALQMGPTVKRLQKPFEYPDIIPLVEGDAGHAFRGPSDIRSEDGEGCLRSAPTHLRRQQ